MSTLALTGGRWVQRAGVKHWVRNPPPPPLPTPIRPPIVVDHLDAELIDIMEAVAAHYSVALDELLGSNRGYGEVVDARHVMRWLLRETGMSFPAVGRAIKRDHTSVISSVRRVDQSPALHQVAVGLRALLERHHLEAAA